MMAEWVKALAIQLKELSVIPGTHTHDGRRELAPASCPLWHVFP